MLSPIDLTWGDGEADWAKKMTASGLGEEDDLERDKDAPPKGLEFEAFTASDVYSGF